MKNVFKKIISLFAILALSFSLFACSSSNPNQSVKSYFDALKNQNLVDSTKYLSTHQSTNINQIDNSEQGKIIKDALSKLDYQIESSNINGNNAIVKVKIISVDFAQITKSMVSSLLPTLVSQAFSGNKPSDEEINNQMVQFLSKEVNDSNAPKITSEININLIKKNNNWLIVPDDNLSNAILGNIASLSNAFNSINNQ